MVSLTEILRKHGAQIEFGRVVMTTVEVDKAATEYAHAFIISELQDLLDRNSSQAYWPAIIKQRINQLKGNG